MVNSQQLVDLIISFLWQYLFHTLTLFFLFGLVLRIVRSVIE